MLSKKFFLCKYVVKKSIHISIVFWHRNIKDFTNSPGDKKDAAAEFVIQLQEQVAEDGSRFVSCGV